MEIGPALAIGSKAWEGRPWQRPCGAEDPGHEEGCPVGQALVERKSGL